MSRNDRRHKAAGIIRLALLWWLGFGLGAAALIAGALGVVTGQRSPFAALGSWAMGRGQASEAESWFTRAQQSVPDSVEAPFNLGVVLFDEKKFEPAAESFSRALSKSRTDDDRSAALYNLASSYVGAGRLAEALDCLAGSLRANPADAAARYNYVLVKRWMSENSASNTQAISPQPEMSKEELERLLNQLGAVPLRSKPRAAPASTGKPDW